MNNYLIQFVTKTKPLLLICLFFTHSIIWAESSIDLSDIKFTADVFASHNHLVTYKGTQDDISATFKLKYPDFRIQPFARLSASNYSYLNESIIGNTEYTDEHRQSAGIGLDFYILLPILRLRYIAETITDKVSNSTHQRESYVFIYNQFIDLQIVQINNYLESSIIPKLSSEKFNTYFRTQIFKPFDITRSADSSNVYYPFVQLKIRDNEEQLFGASGNLTSVGLGLKNYTRLNGRSSISFLLEGHTVVLQSKEFNSDWNQLVAVAQYSFN